MLLFDVGMGCDPVVDMIQESRGREKGAATLTAFQGMTADDLVADRDGAHIVLIAYLDDPGRTDIYTGTAADAASLQRNDIAQGAVLFHGQGGGPHDLAADPDAKPAADAAVGGRTDIDAPVDGHLTQALGLRRHGQQMFKCVAPRLPHEFSAGFNPQPFLGLQDARKLGGRPPAFAHGFHGAEMTDPGRFEGRVMTKGRQFDSVGPGHVKDALVGFGFYGQIVDLDLDQCFFLHAGQDFD